MEEDVRLKESGCRLNHDKVLVVHPTLTEVVLVVEHLVEDRVAIPFPHPGMDLATVDETSQRFLHYLKKIILHLQVAWVAVYMHGI